VAFDVSVERLSVAQPTINNELMRVKGKVTLIVLSVPLYSSSADLLKIVM
jgi:hypothetical protein